MKEAMPWPQVDQMGADSAGNNWHRALHLYPEFAAGLFAGLPVLVQHRHPG
jgi:hypothetical protein